MYKKITIFVLSAVIFFTLSTQSALAYDFTSTPVKVVIPSLSLSLPVTTARVTSDTWEVSLTGASYGDSTALPGTVGNTVIFAHARDRLFATLPQVKKGDIVHVFTKEDWLVYEIVETKIVNPEDISVLADSDERILTLYTCIGDDYAKRFIVRARLATGFTP